ncbi:MAG: aminotransferase class V-fold PLP-dependent enzyme [Terriglobia bacterium]|jgi:selenocysteine lyase/cysteine desulfurase
MRNYRQEFSDFSPTVYLDCAYQGPFPLATRERLYEAIELKVHPDRLDAPEYFRLPERVRARIARLVGAGPSEIALTTSATQGIGIVAAGLGLGPGDEVVVASSNFPSNLFTWLHLRRKGVVVKVLASVHGEVGLEPVAAALSARTRVLALDWVNYTSGYRIDLATMGELVHARGGIFVVDGTQGVGAQELDLNALPVDVLVCAAYKWLLGPYGTGFAYVRRELLGKLDLPVINWYSVEGAEDFDSLPSEQFRLIHDARVFDSGETGNFINLHGLDASLEFLEGVTPRAAYEHCRRLLERLADGLRAQGCALSAASRVNHESTILGFQACPPEATTELHRKLRAHHIAVSLRQGVIRVSPYLYNDETDIDRLLEVVARPGE